jgi:hypothetical protein
LIVFGTLAAAPGASRSGAYVWRMLTYVWRMLTYADGRLTFVSRTTG